MDMAGHQAIDPDLAPGPSASFEQPVAIEGIVVLGKEGRFAPIIGLDYMMRRPGTMRWERRAMVIMQQQRVK